MHHHGDHTPTVPHQQAHGRCLAEDHKQLPGDGSTEKSGHTHPGGSG